MRVERPGDRLYHALLGAVALAIGLVFGLGLAGAGGAVVGGVLGAMAAVWLHRSAARREGARRAAVASPLSEKARRFLRERYDHYDRLPPEWRARFDDDVRIFLAEKRITGVEVAAQEELRLLVAASAVTLSLGWPDYAWDQLTEVLLYPESFDRDYRFVREGNLGMTHATGEVILSVQSLRRSFEDPDDGFHVGLHEFAHLLDKFGSEFDGTPAGLAAPRARAWAAIAEKEMAALRDHRDSAFDDYGEDDPVEFLPVAVEAFFETPTLVRRLHPEVYAILAEFFRQDPAAWDDLRGIDIV